MFRQYLGGKAYDDFDCEILNGHKSDHPDAWKVRPCEWYREEFSNCANFFQRFNQRFIHGKSLDCGHWMTDYKNCLAFRHTGDEKFLQKVIDSENRRLKFFQDNSKGNDVWEPRTNPPSNWKSKLPDWWYEKIEGSRINRYIDEENTKTTGENRKD